MDPCCAASLWATVSIFYEAVFAQHFERKFASHLAEMASLARDLDARSLLL